MEKNNISDANIKPELQRVYNELLWIRVRLEVGKPLSNKWLKKIMDYLGPYIDEKIAKDFVNENLKEWAKTKSRFKLLKADDSEIQKLIDAKTKLILEAQTLAAKGMEEESKAPYSEASDYEERIANMYEANNNYGLAKTYFISATNCAFKAGLYEKTKELMNLLWREYELSVERRSWLGKLADKISVQLKENPENSNEFKNSVENK